MRVLACDPSTKHLAFAMWSHEKKAFYTQKISGDFTRLVLELENYFLGMPGGGDIHFFCEDQYTGPNRQTGIKIAVMRGVVNAAAVRHGFVLHDPTKATHWQGLLTMPKGSTYPQRKKRAMEIASVIMGAPVLDSDVADAICICEYEKNRLQTKERLSAQGTI